MTDVRHAERLLARRLPGLLAVAALVLAPVAAASTAPAPVPLVTTTLSVSTAGAGAPTAISDVTVVVPSDWREAMRLQQTSPSANANAYRRILVALLNRLALLDEFDVERIVRAASPLRKPTIAEGQATVTLTSSAPLGYYDNIVWPWRIDARGKDFVFEIAPGDDKATVAWRVVVRVDAGIELDNWTPGVVVGGPSAVEWRFRQGADAPRLSARAKVSTQVQSRLYSSDWRHYLAQTTQLLLAGLIPALVLLLGWRTVFLASQGDGRYEAATVWARRLAVAALVVVAAQVLAVTVRSEWLRSWLNRHTREHWYYSYTIVTGAEAVIAALAILLVVGLFARRSTARRWFAAVVLALLVAVVSVPLVLAVWPEEEAPSLVPRTEWVLNALAVGLVLVLGTALALIAFRATARLAADIEVRDVLTPELHAAASRLLPTWPWVRRLRWLRPLAAPLAAVGLAGYWLHDGIELYDDAAKRFDGVRLWEYLRTFPLDVVWALQPLLSLLLLLALVAIVWGIGSSSTRPILERRRTVTWAIGLAFAGWVVGLDGSLWLVALPVPAVAAVAAVMYFGGGQLEARQTELARANPGNPSPPPTLGDEAFRAEMLARAREIAAVRRKKRTLYAKYRETPLGEGAYDLAFRAAQRLEDQLRTGGSVDGEPSEPEQSSLRRRIERRLGIDTSTPTPARRLVVLPEGSTPYSFALSLGPRQSWWQNGALAAGFALVLAVVPLARFAYHFRWSTGGFAPYNAFVAFTFELAHWVVAGLVFGCLYAYLPGRVGPVKALVLPASVAVAAGLFSLVPKAAVPSGVASDLALLALFLAVVGIVMDWWTLRVRRLDARHLGDLYELHILRKIAILAPPAIAILGIANALAGGDWNDVKGLFDGIVDLLKSLG